MEISNEIELAEQSLSKSELTERHEFFKASVPIALGGLVIADVALSFAPIFTKLIEKELSPTATIFNRVWVGATLFGLWTIIKALSNRVSDQPTTELKSYTSWDLKSLLVVGITFPLSQISWAWSLTQTSAAISGLLHEMSPIFTSLGVWWLFAQGFDRKFLIGMIVSIAGAIAIGLQDAQIASSQVEGDAAALLSAVFYGGYLIGLEQLRSKFSNTTIMLLVSASSAVLPLMVLLSQRAQLFPHSWHGWLFVIALAVICQVIGQGLTSYSIKKFSSGFVALFSLLIPVLTAILAQIIFSETLNLISWLAFAVVLLGLYLGISSKSAIKN